MSPHAPPLPPEGADPAWGGPAPDRMPVRIKCLPVALLCLAAVGAPAVLRQEEPLPNELGDSEAQHVLQ